MEFVTPIVSVVVKIAENTVGPLWRQVSYVIHYKRNLQILRSHAANLGYAKDRMQHTLDDEVKRKGKRVEADVEKWLTEVDEITQEVDAFLEDERHARTKCFHDFFSNPILQHRLSRKSTKLVHKVELHEKMEFPTVSYNVRPQDVCGIPSQDYLAFESRTSIVKDIMEELRNPDTNMIGVYGIGGVGKTTLAKQVFRQVTEEKLFDDVVIVLDVKLIPDLEGIQKQILEKMGMDVIEGQTTAIRASHLWDRIKDKKILVILDDVSERIDLEAVGLLRVATCNILLTARTRPVLFSEMRTQKDFQLNVLGKTETWRLFEMVAGDVVKENPIREVAMEVAKKCGDLPLLVVAVASALRISTLNEWKDALRLLKTFELKELAEKALLTLEWSYNQLGAEELKSLFLLCGILAYSNNSIFLSDCFKYSMGLGLLKNVDTMEEAQAAFLSRIKKLQNYCLLLEQQDGNNYTTVRMHELVRSVAIMIARRDKHALLRPDEEGFKEWPNKDFFENCTMIFLPFSNIPSFPEVPWECRELKMLHFNSRDELLEIPSNFFEEMKELKVLDLTQFCIPSLPSSLNFLTNLQALCFYSCVLGDIAIVGQLRSLEILSIWMSKITQLPKEIGQLARLRMLDLTGCSELVLISPNVIASLKNLEDLRMGRNSFRQWEAKGVRNASLLELKQLSKLTALDIHIPDANILPSDCFSELERFHIFIGEAWEWLPFDNSVNTLKLKLDTSSQLDTGLEMLLKRCEHLYLDVTEGVNNISHLLNKSDGFQQLKHLQVQNNAEITHVFNYNAFQNLQSLTLWNLPKLVSFSSEGGTAVVTTRTDNEIGSPVQLSKSREILMHNLTRLIVHKCDGLSFLLSSSMARSLVQLKHLEIRSCQIMEEIVSTKESAQENTENLFCKLTHLELQHLPKLTRFCSRNLIKFPSLEILHLEDCTELQTFISDPPMISDNITICKDNDKSNLKDNLETLGQHVLFNEKVAFPSLERLIIYDLPKLITTWHNQLAQDSFCRLKTLDIQRCHYLINIFASSIMGRLNALDTLHIKDCKSLQVLFELDGINTEKTDESSGTQLRIFECCQNLDLVKIISCERLKNIFPASVVKSLHNIRMLHVELCNGVETIVGKEEGPQTTIPKFMFPKVISVNFQNLPQLMSFYPGMHSSQWPLLKQLMMIGCNKVGIFASEFLRFQEKVASTPGSKQPFFLIEKGSLLNLETLLLGDAELEIWDGPLPEELSATWPWKLKEFWCASKSSAAFLEKLRNLELLSMAYTPFKEIFVNEAYSSSVGSPQLLHLTFLHLYKMPELVHLGKDNSQPVIPNLKILEVYLCVRLRNLTSPAIAFQNLTSLKVIGCHGLEFLTTCSIAQSLMQLKHMEVKDCRGLIQILENSNQDLGSIEIAFLRLQHLELSGLPSLQCFCSGNCIVKLPSLDTLTVTDCLIELELSPEKLLHSNSRPEKIKLIEEEEKDHDKPEGSGKT